MGAGTQSNKQTNTETHIHTHAVGLPNNMIKWTNEKEINQENQNTGERKENTHTR